MSKEKKETIEMKSFNDEISLKDFIVNLKNWLFYIKYKWKIIFLVSLICALIGLTRAFLDKINYKATLTFAMEEDKASGGVGGALGLASSFGIDIGGGAGGAFAASNLTELMKSKLIVKKVLLSSILVNGKRMSLAEFYIQINNLRTTWLKNPNSKKIQFPPNLNESYLSITQDSILQSFYNDLINNQHLLITQKDKRVSILTIEVNHENELFAKYFCEGLARETSDFYIETKSKKARLNVDILQKQVDSIRNSLNGAITNVAIANDDMYNLNPAFNIKGVVSRKKQVEVQSNSALLTNLIIQLELAKITLRKETPLIQIIDMPYLPLLKEKLGKIKSFVFGAIIGFFLCFIYLSIIYFYKTIINEES